MEQKSHKGLKRLLITAGVIAVLFLSMYFAMTMTAKKELDSLTFTPVDMNQVEDGTYQGTTETTLVKVDVEVTVQDHKITNVQILRHENGKGQKAEKLVDDMVTENTYDVDGVSGATMSSQVIKSAVNKAILLGVK